MNSCNCNQNFNGKCARASLRNIAPSCKNIAIIPSITVENLQSMKGLADCFVHVISNNTTYYIDNNGRLTILSEGLVTADNYDISANPLKLQNQLLSTTIDNVQQVVFYDAQRRPHELALMDNIDATIVEEVDNKIAEMANNGELGDIVADYLSESVNVIFPTYGMDGSDTLGDCSIIKTKNKVVMIDTFSNSATTFASIQNALYSNDINHIDLFIISHYDGDHYGNYQRIIDSGLINSARIILPRSVVRGDINKTGNDMKAALTAAGLTYETADNQTIEIDDNVVMKMFNASAEDYAYYDSEGVTNYNNYSVCCEFDCYGRRMLFTGDCLTTACEYIASRYLSSNYDLIKDNHHSFCGYVSTYANTVNPDYVVCPTSVGMINANIGRRGNLITAWSQMTKNIYVQGVQPEPLVMTVDYNGVTPNDKAIATIDFGSMSYFDYYIDSTTTSARRDGSEQYPFKSLAEASAMMSKHSRADVILHVINLDDITTDVNFVNFDRLTIDFDNKTINKNLTFSNINMLKLSNVNTSALFKVENCRASINNITSTSDIDDQIILQESDVYLRGDLVSSNAVKSFLFIQRSSISLVISSLAYTQANTDARALKLYESNVSLSPSTETVLSAYNPTSELTYYTQLRYLAQYEKICTIFEHTTEGPTDTVDLRDLTTDFDGVKVLLKNNDNYCTTVVIDKDYDRTVVSTPLPSGAKDKIYWNLATVIIDSNKKQMHLARYCQFVLQDSGITHSDVANITIMKVVGIPK